MQHNATAIIPFDPQKLAAALKQTTREVAPVGQFLRMEKSGDWVYGIEQDAVPDNAEFAVNPGGFSHGYICWGEGVKLGEVSVPVTDPIPDTGPVPGGGRGWEFQLGIHIKGTNGTLKDTDMIYRVSSVGGKRAIAGLASLVSEKLIANDAKMVPVITLGSDSYKHKEFGKIFVPVFEVTKWMPMPATEKQKPQAKRK